MLNSLRVLRSSLQMPCAPGTRGPAGAGGAPGGAAPPLSLSPVSCWSRSRSRRRSRSPGALSPAAVVPTATEQVTEEAVPDSARGRAACAPGPSGEHSKGEEVRPRSRLGRPAATSATGRTFHPLPGVLAATLAATQRRCYINSSCSQRRHLRAARRHLRGCRATRPETGESGEI